MKSRNQNEIPTAYSAVQTPKDPACPRDCIFSVWVTTDRNTVTKWVLQQVCSRAKSQTYALVPLPWAQDQTWYLVRSLQTRVFEIHLVIQHAKDFFMRYKQGYLSQKSHLLISWQEPARALKIQTWSFFSSWTSEKASWLFSTKQLHIFINWKPYTAELTIKPCWFILPNEKGQETAPSLHAVLLAFQTGLHASNRIISKTACPFKKYNSAELFWLQLCVSVSVPPILVCKEAGCVGNKHMLHLKK